jgi:hypothetical protein
MALAWQPSQRPSAVGENPYAAEGEAAAIAEPLTVSGLRSIVATLAASARTANELCLVAELYKRLGDVTAASFYERAIAAAPSEPGYELFYGEYLRVYRGAGDRPLFPRAERHLLAARAKLAARRARPGPAPDWEQTTAERLSRALTALYERDGAPLGHRPAQSEDATAAGERPWLFVGVGTRVARDTADLDRTDIRDLTSAAAFASSAARLGRPLTMTELSGLARPITPLELTGRVRVRTGAGPVLDGSVAGLRTGNAQVTDFYSPNAFNALALASVGAAAEQSFTLGRTIDALAQMRVNRVVRQGLLEFLPDAAESIVELAATGAISRYAGPDRWNLRYTYVRQRIDPEPVEQESRTRVLTGATGTYRLFRPIAGRTLNAGLGRAFEPRGIDLFAGLLDDREQFPARPVDVFVTRRDYFAGVTARGLGRTDITLQPTWYSSRVTSDPSQDNRQFRLAATIVARLLDEERTRSVPSQRIAGLPVAFVHLVVPIHWDAPLEGLDAFRSRRAGIELWTKVFTGRAIGVTTLCVAAYTRQQFPAIGKSVNGFSLRASVGF